MEQDLTVKVAEQAEEEVSLLKNQHPVKTRNRQEVKMKRVLILLFICALAIAVFAVETNKDMLDSDTLGYLYVQPKTVLGYVPGIMPFLQFAYDAVAQQDTFILVNVFDTDTCYTKIIHVDDSTFTLKQITYPVDSVYSLKRNIIETNDLWRVIFHSLVVKFDYKIGY